MTLFDDEIAYCLDMIMFFESDEFTEQEKNSMILSNDYDNFALIEASFINLAANIIMKCINNCKRKASRTCASKPSNTCKKKS